MRNNENQETSKMRIQCRRKNNLAINLIKRIKRIVDNLP